MQITVTGANSAVGRALLQLEEAGETVFAAVVRSKRAASQLPELPNPGSRIVIASYQDPAGLDSALAGADAVVHLPGLLVERPGSTYETANMATARSVIEASLRAHVKKFVLTSAIGADPASSNRYFRTKAETEALVIDSGISYTVLRLPLVLGKATAGSAALQRHLKHPTAWLPGGGRHLQQPLHVRDAARAALRASSPAVALDRVLELAGPTCLPEREILERAASLRGRDLRIRTVPRRLLMWILAVRQRFSGPGFSTDVLEVITRETQVDPDPAAEALGIPLTGLDEMIQDGLAGETTR